MSQWDLQANETSMYFKNYVNDEVVEAVQKKFMEGYDTIYVSFDVMGRTFHEQLSYQLSLRLRALYGPKVNIDVGYNYQCDVKWVTNLSQVVVKEPPTGVRCDSCAGCSDNIHVNPEGDCHLIVVPEHGEYSIQDIDNAIKNRGLLQSE